MMKKERVSQDQVQSLYLKITLGKNILRNYLYSRKDKSSDKIM